MTMFPIFIPRTSFWRHAIPRDHEVTGNYELDEAYRKYRGGDQLSSRAHLYQMRWGSAAPAQALALRATSLESLLDAGSVAQGSMLAGGAERLPDMQAVRRMAAAASGQSVEFPEPAWQELLLSTRWKKRVGDASDPELAPWIELFDAWQQYQYGNRDEAHSIWKRLAYADGLDKQITGFASLAVVQTAGEAMLATRDGAWANEAINAAGWAYSAFQAAANPDGCAQAQLLSGEIDYAIGKKPLAQHELSGADAFFKSSGDVAGVAEVNLTGGLGEGLTGNPEIVEPALAEAEDLVGERRIPAAQVECLIEFSRRLPELLARTDERPVEQRLVDAREAYRWASATEEPLLQLILLRILSNLLRQASRWSDASFYDAVREDLSARYGAAVPFRLRLKRALFLDYDFLRQSQMLQRQEYETTKTNCSAEAEAMLAAKAALQGEALRLYPDLDPAVLEANAQNFAEALRTLAGRVDQASGQFNEQLKAGDRDGAVQSLADLIGKYDILIRFLNEVNLTTSFSNPTFQLKRQAFEQGKNNYEVHVNLAAHYRMEVIARTKVEMLQIRTSCEALRDVLIGVVYEDERYLGRGAKNLAAFYESYRDFLSPPQALDEPFTFLGGLGGIQFPNLKDARAALIDTALKEHVNRYIETLIREATSADPMVPGGLARSGSDNQKYQQARQFFEANWEQDSTRSRIDHHQAAAVETGGRIQLTIDHAFSAAYKIREDSTYFTLPEKNAGVDFHRRAKVVRAHADCPAFPAGLPRFDRVLQLFRVEGGWNQFLTQYLGFGFEQLAQMGAAFSALADPGQIALSLTREDDFLARPGAHSFLYWQSLLRADAMALNLVSTLAYLDPDSTDAKEQIQTTLRNLIGRFEDLHSGKDQPAEPAHPEEQRAAAAGQDRVQPQDAAAWKQELTAQVFKSSQAGRKLELPPPDKFQFLHHMAGIAQVLGYRPLLLLLLGDTQAAAQAADGLSAKGERQSIADMVNLAVYWIATADYPKAIEALARLLPALRQQDISQVFQVEYLLALCHRRAGNADAELAGFRAATEDLEQLRRSLRTRNQVLALHEVRQTIYEDYAGASFAKQRYDEMAGTLRRYQQSSQMPIAVLQTEAEKSPLKELVREATFLYDILSRDAIWNAEDCIWLQIQAELLPQLAAAPADPRQAVMSGLNHIANVLVDQIRPVDGRTGQSVPFTPASGLYISYFVGKSGLYRVTRSHSGEIFARFTPCEEAHLNELCAGFRGAIEQGVEAPSALYDLLLGELPELERAENLFLSLDGALNLIPFQALRTPSGRYLVEDHTVTYVSGPSAPHSPPVPAGKRILVVGNPDGSLPAAEAEARAIAKLPQFEPAKPLLRSSATLENVRSRLADADLVHLATHARANQPDPNFSYLQLANWDRLYSIDLGGLSFSGKHVFLSACETRLGEVLPGEDVYGIADAFLAANASSVIATLWRIEDESCALFAQRYYALLAETQRPASALAMAAREFIGGKVVLESDGGPAPLSAPFFWAAFNHLSPTLPVHSAGA